MNYYRLFIHTDQEGAYERAGRILGVEPNLFNDDNTLWCYALEEKDETESIPFVNIYMDILEPCFDELEKIGIARKDISIWRIYEYEQQCAMEISPDEMKRLGNNGITLCIDCFQR